MFTKCNVCGERWGLQREFLHDSKVDIIGYQVDFVSLPDGFFLFRHEKCKNSLSVRVGDFADLYNGPIYDNKKEEVDKCPDFCLRVNDLRPCPEKCECAYVREIIQKIKKWPKQAIH